MKLFFTFTTLLLFGCSDVHQLVRDLNVDFPQAEELTKVADYTITDVFNPTNFVVKDSVLFTVERGDGYLARCYNINTGKEISKLILKGKAQNEMMNVEALSLYGNDSINAISYNYPKKVKTYGLDFVTNKEGSSSEITIPDTISSFSFDKISDNLIVGSGGSYNSGFSKYFILKDNVLTQFCGHDKVFFEANLEIERDVLSTWQSLIVANSSKDKIVTSTKNGLLIDVVDLKNQSLDRGRCYEKIKLHIERFEGGCSTQPKSNLRTESISCDDKNIFISISGVDKEKNSTQQERIRYLLVFDWNLNPIKKYNLGSGTYQLKTFLSPDGKYLYVLQPSNDEQYSLTKYQL